MRTTLELSDDAVLSDLAREALVRPAAAGPEESSFYGFEPLPHRGPAVSNELIDRLREDDPE